uniref:adenylate cyclase n=1 Tax=Macrostomum lignano TaxID=282301 RepID=A0A1I8JPN3_9PLAT
MSHRFDEHGDGGGGGGGGGSDSAKLYRQHLLRHHSHQQQQQQQRASAFFFAELNTDLATYADPAAISDSDRRLCCPDAAASAEATEVPAGFSVLSKRHAFRWDRKLLLRLLPLHSIFALTMAAAEAAAVAAAPSAASASRCCLYTTTLALLCGAACFVSSRRFQPGSHAGAAAALDLACAALMSVAALPLSAARPAALPSGLWQVAPLLLSVLCLLPLPILLTAGYCVMLATGYTVCSGLLAYRRCGGGSGGETAMLEACRHLRAHFWNSLAGCIIVQVAVLSVGALLQRSREADLAASLRHARRYIASRVSLERQTDKLDRLVTSLVPQMSGPRELAELPCAVHRASRSLLENWRRPHRLKRFSSRVRLHRRVLTTFSGPSFCVPPDAPGWLHQLLCQHDGPPHSARAAAFFKQKPLWLSQQDYQGYRGSFDGDTYLVTFGFPLATDACRAQQALQFSLALHEFVSGLAERSHLPLTLRVGIACGPVSGCVLGQQRIVYGLVGEAADTADALQRLCQPG